MEQTLELRPLSARSVVLSLMLGAHPPELPVKDLVRRVEPFDVSESTLRVALSRMVAAGDLVRTEVAYRLSDRLLERQRRQDEALHPKTKAWRGGWEVAVVTAVGRSAPERAELRAELTGLRLAELREGVWTRPDNLRRPWPEHLRELVVRFVGRPDEPRLVDSLWHLESWASTAGALHAMFTMATHPADRLTMAAAMVRLLRTDPVLPPELTPDGWPAATLRAAYAAYQTELAAFSEQVGATAGDQGGPS